MRPTPTKKKSVSSFCNSLINLVARRDAEGHVIIGPRNFTTKKIKQGHLDSSLLSKPSYVSVDDPFKPSLEKVMRTSDP